MTWVWIQHSSECKWLHFIAAEIFCHQRTCAGHCLLSWRYCPESTSRLLCCYVVTCEPNRAGTLRAFHAEFICDGLIGWNCSGEWQLGASIPTCACTLSMSHAMTASSKPFFEGGRQKGCWMDNIKEWTFLPMPDLLTRASCRQDWKRIAAESSLMSPWWPKWSRDWTEM